MAAIVLSQIVNLKNAKLGYGDVRLQKDMVIRRGLFLSDKQPKKVSEIKVNRTNQRKIL